MTLTTNQIITLLMIYRSSVGEITIGTYLRDLQKLYKEELIEPEFGGKPTFTNESSWKVTVNGEATVKAIRKIPFAY